MCEGQSEGLTYDGLIAFLFSRRGSGNVQAVTRSSGERERGRGGERARGRGREGGRERGRERGRELGREIGRDQP